MYALYFKRRCSCSGVLSKLEERSLNCQGQDLVNHTPGAKQN